MGGFHVTGDGQGCDDRGRWMLEAEGTSQELRTKEIGFPANEEDVGFGVEVVERGRVLGAGGESKGVGLYSLKSGKRRSGDWKEPDYKIEGGSGWGTK